MFESFMDFMYGADWGTKLTVVAVSGLFIASFFKWLGRKGNSSGANRGQGGQ